MTGDERDDAQETITVQMSDGRYITLVTDAIRQCSEPEGEGEEDGLNAPVAPFGLGASGDGGRKVKVLPTQSVVEDQPLRMALAGEETEEE